ncbi:MAG TPA: SDR family oxidoreductase [Allosphingosinicella sp.]|jgi:NAD(P)-dependent dehydrogenase (short-subunit alcohol dehydrogenase family)|nr:SDR family oxidoreductase [Allosphingosinicella sp.]
MLMEGKAVLVTGTASGIGRETALTCAREGATRIACLDIHDANNEATAHELEALGARAIALHCDVGDVDQIRAAYKVTFEEFARLDAAAHIGGYSWRGETLDVTVEQWEQVINVNLRGTFFCCQEALRIMYPQGSGAIVNTSADAAFNPIYGFALQAAGKGGIVNMTKTLALEAAPRGVRVNVVSPGIVRTQKAGAGRPPQPELRRDNPPPADAVNRLGELTAIGRYMRMEEVADTFVFLCSDRASGINGDLVFVNGGGYPTLDY